MAQLPKKNLSTYGVSTVKTKVVKVNGKEITVHKKHVIKANDNEVTINIPAYSKDYTIFHGWDQLTLPALTETGHKAFKDALDLTDQHNWARAKMTDVRNDLARWVSPEQVVADFKAGKATFAQASHAIERLAKSGNKKAKEVLDNMMKQAFTL